MPERKPNREANTPALLLWEESRSFIAAPTQVSQYRTPQLHLMAHGIELALKSYLRANGFSLSQLKDVGHSLSDALEQCGRKGMAMPKHHLKRRFAFLADAHGSHEWRYGHLDRPPHMDHADWAPVAEWALRAAIPAVATNEALRNGAVVVAYVHRMESDVQRIFPPSDR